VTERDVNIDDLVEEDADGDADHANGTSTDTASSSANIANSSVSDSNSSNVLPSASGLSLLSSSSSPSSHSPHLAIIDLKDLRSLRRLNEGVGGVAFLATLPNGEKVVVKTPKRAVIGSEEWLELQLHMSVPPHENIVPFLGICMVQLQVYFVTKFQERGSLKSLLSLPSSAGGDAIRSYYAHPFYCIHVAMEVARALEHLHLHHVVHRDVAARNVLVSAEGRHVLSDFGLARWMQKREIHNGEERKEDDAEAEEEELDDTSPSSLPDPELYTMHGVTALPARWTPPESLRSHSFSGRSDVYSLGVLMWEMASGGATPYASIRDNLSVIMGVATGELQLDDPPNAHPAIVHFIRRCMAPAKSRPTVTEARREMEEWLNRHQRIMVKLHQECQQYQEMGVQAEQQIAQADAERIQNNDGAALPQADGVDAS